MENWVPADQATGRLTSVPNGYILNNVIPTYTQNFGVICFDRYTSFQIFNIDLFSFQIAGAILLINIALRMLSEKNGFSSDKREDPSIIPLTFPLTAGPRTITTVILIFSQASSFFETIFVFVAIAVGVLLSYGGMIHAHRLLKIFGTDGTHVVSALMSIIVLAIALQFVFAGIVAAVCQITF